MKPATRCRVFFHDPSGQAGAVIGNAGPKTNARDPKDAIMARIDHLKTEARALRAQNPHLTHSAALESVAQSHGYRDWNTASADAQRPLELGAPVAGHYLGHAFTGRLLDVQTLDASGRQRLTVQFDTPIDVVESQHFSAYRQRATATVEANGVSPARLGNGTPQMQIWRDSRRM